MYLKWNPINNNLLWNEANKSQLVAFVTLDKQKDKTL